MNPNQLFSLSSPRSSGPTTVMFFGNTGCLLSENDVYGGKTWRVQIDGFSFLTEPDDMMPAINKELNKNFGHEVARIKVGSTQAITLFLQGLISAENLNQATTGAVDGKQFVDIHGVIINHKAVVVRVMEDLNGVVIEYVDGSH